MSVIRLLGLTGSHQVGNMSVLFIWDNTWLGEAS